MFIALGGKLVDNYGTTTLVNNTAKTETLTVPVGKRWHVLGGFMQNNDSVARDCKCDIQNASSQYILGTFYEDGAVAGRHNYFPSARAIDGYSMCNTPLLILDAGFKVLLTWSAGGASAGGTSKFAFVVLETDLT